MGYKYSEIYRKVMMWVMELLVSVIIPVYKVEKYLSKCVESVINQTYKNMEIVLVDDGSPDACGKICDDYTQKDARIKVIHKKNGGLSDARNVALDVCTGDYITFIDSDDWVSRYYISNLLSAISKSGKKLAVSWFQNIREGDMEVEACNVEDSRIISLSTEEALKKMFYQDGIESSAWGKLYAKELFTEIRYPKGKLYEDIPVTYKMIEKACGVALIPNTDYYYLQRNDSIQYQKFDVRKMDGVFHWEVVMSHVERYYPQLISAVHNRYFRCVCNILFQIKDDSAVKYRKELWERVKKERSYILRDSNSRISSRAAALLSFLGYGVTNKIYHMTQMRG